MSPYCAAAAASSTVFCGGRPSITDTSPNCRSPSTRTTGSVERFAIATATLIATQVLPTPPLVENTDDQAARAHPARVVGARRTRGVAPASSSPTRSTDWCRLASPPITTASRAPARSACCSTSVDSSFDREHRTELGVRAGDAVHVLEAHRADEAGTEHGDHRTRRVEALRRALRSSRTDAAPASSTARRVRSAWSGSTTATSNARGLDAGVDRGVGLHGVTGCSPRRRRPTAGRRRLPGGQEHEVELARRRCWRRSPAARRPGLTSKVSRPESTSARRPSVATPAGAAAHDRRGADREHLDVAQDVRPTTEAAVGVGRRRGRDVDVVTRRDLVGDAAVGVDVHRDRDQVLLGDRRRRSCRRCRPRPTRRSAR